MSNLTKILLLLFIIALHIDITHAQEENEAFSHTVKTEKKPWTSKPFYNNPENFQFAIVSDRTGGHRKGVFGDALHKINKLYPEFVMSVGDLIEGYTKDESLIDEQWAEFDSILNPLSTRFFYVAGNHDYSNAEMGAQWKERYGKDYYHFIYKDVLFLILNTNDGDGVLLGDDQIAFLKQTISENSDVRWTMIYMHHPLWAFGDVNGFDEIEAAIADRKYTVFAGHTHRYMHDVKNDQNHYVLGTTGGGSKLRGPKFGEFDHVGWVTMTDEGPKLVNLSLSGIIDQDVSNRTTQKMAKALIDATNFNTLVLGKDTKRKILMTLNNASEDTIHFRGQLFHHHQIQPDVSKFQLSLPPQSQQQITLATKPIGDSEISEWDPLEMQWEMGYDSAFMAPEFNLHGTETIELNPSSVGIKMTEDNIFFKEMQIEVSHPYQNIQARYTTDGQTPETESTIFPEKLTLDNSTNIKIMLTDNEGYRSTVFNKKYEKVKPSAVVKTKRPKKGLSYTYYEGNFTAVPDFSSLSNPKKTGSVTELDPDKIGERLDHYAIQYKGYIEVPETGIYTFYLKSDDGSKLYIDDELVVDNDGSHNTSTKKGLKALKKGMHAVRIDYFEDFLGEELQLDYAGAGVKKSPASFWH
ncbi:PA14 domain-containing protein [uncultured Kriegella sp.]|uniref:PA14 domain-containing protein n=1 Tax=uncultured Kriegella sp. TaxID=1798910 RepID=UPI0030DCE2BD|tara:strand:+ start:71831 stop:73741 length:1911 start_codon:yes stop_codon:yes gene_type:complete